MSYQGASIFWGQQLSATQENASKTIVPACSIIMDISYRAKDLIKKELSAFSQIIDNSHYMLPSMPEVCTLLAQNHFLLGIYLYKYTIM